jgi:serine/threonine protein kinase
MVHLISQGSLEAFKMKENISQRYEVRYILGKGSSAEVYLAYDTITKKYCALKYFENWGGMQMQSRREATIVRYLNDLDPNDEHGIGAD